MLFSWHSLSAAEALAKLQTNEHGLSSADAAARLVTYGANALPSPKTESWPRLFARQFHSPLIAVLGACAVAMALLGDATDAGIIGFVLLFNAAVGSIQEGRAAKTLAGLRSLAAGETAVLREGEERRIPDTQLVPGDIVILREGDRVPADCRLLSADRLRIDESAITGESVPVLKDASALPAGDHPPAERTNMLWQGTAVVAGGGRAAVVATGAATTLGGIAQKIVSVDTEIPLKANIRALSMGVVRAVALLAAGMFAFGVFSGRSVTEMFATVVSLAVSVIPEGLPIVITLVLSVGVWRMGKRNALVKKLQAVEALGQADVIAVDKTGTITENALAVREAISGDAEFTASGIGFAPEGEVRRGGAPATASSDPALAFLADCALRCASGRAAWDEKTGRWKPSGDPTEVALWAFGMKSGATQREDGLVADIPFTSATKFHATVSKAAKGQLLVVLGAPETVLSRCALDEAERAAIAGKVEGMASRGLRVLALGTATGASIPADPERFPQLEFGGLYGMADGLRQNVAASVATAQRAGLRIVMITGDHRATAQAIARDAGIFRPGDEAVDGSRLTLMNNAELDRLLPSVSVFSRIAPDDKLRIIEAFRRHGKIVAMTGDGVNDAPALVAADLGVAMGKMGTETAKEAADIVLLDDNFSTIVAAVEEGRSIFKTVKKVVLYLFSTSAGEALTIAGCLVAGLPLPLLPGQIVWLNLVTDTFLDVSLGMEPREPGLLDPGFRAKDRRIIDRAALLRIGVTAVTMAAGTAGLFLLFLGDGLQKARTMALTVLAAYQWFNAWNCRDEKRSIFAMHPLGNPHLIAATTLVITLHLLAVYHPVGQSVLRTVPLTLGEWGLILATALSIVVVEEIRKAFARRASARQPKMS